MPPRLTKRAGPARGRRQPLTKTISASVPAPVAARTVAVAERAQWKVSQVVANALDLYTALPASALQRLTELEHGAQREGNGRVGALVARVVERELDRLEWESVAAATRDELAGHDSDRAAIDLADPDALDQATDAAIAASRTARRRLA